MRHVGDTLKASLFQRRLFSFTHSITTMPISPRSRVHVSIDWFRFAKWCTTKCNSLHPTIPSSSPAQRFVYDDWIGKTFEATAENNTNLKTKASRLELPKNSGRKFPQARWCWILCWKNSSCPRETWTWSVKNILQQSVSEIIETHKLIEAKNLLCQTDKSVSGNRIWIGLSWKTYFNSVFKKSPDRRPLNSAQKKTLML